MAGAKETGEAHSGGCQCGAIRYRISGQLGRATLCHCRMCQKAFGSFAAALVFIADDQVTWTRGRPAEFRSSRPVARGFCPHCGTPLFMREDGSGLTEISVGSLDEPNSVKFTDQAGVESKLRWFDSLHELPSMRTDQERTLEDLATLKSLQHPDHDTPDQGPDAWPPR